MIVEQARGVSERHGPLTDDIVGLCESGSVGRRRALVREVLQG